MTTERDTPTCERCGTPAVRATTPLAKLWRWFREGQGAAEAWRCPTCGASWSRGGGYLLMGRRSSGLARGLRLPRDVLDALRGARTWHPIPVFYAYVGAASLVPAAVLAATTRLRWRVALAGIPVAAMVVTFLWSLVSAFGPRGRRDVLMRLAPQRGIAREHHEQVAALRRDAGRFPLLAPQGWDGELAIGGTGWSVPPRGPIALREVTVVADHGEPDPSRDPEQARRELGSRGPSVEVRVTSEPLGRGGLEAAALDELVAREWSPDAPDLEDLDPHEARRRTEVFFERWERERGRRATELAAGWRDGMVQVDGADVTARLLTGQRASVATLELGEHAVTVLASGIEVEGLRLERITDPEPLIAEMSARHHRRTTRGAGT